MLTKEEISQRINNKLNEAWAEAYALEDKGKNFTNACKKVAIFQAAKDKLQIA